MPLTFGANCINTTRWFLDFILEFNDFTIFMIFMNFLWISSFRNAYLFSLVFWLSQKLTKSDTNLKCLKLSHFFELIMNQTSLLPIISKVAIYAPDTNKVIHKIFTGQQFSPGHFCLRPVPVQLHSSAEMISPRSVALQYPVGIGPVLDQSRTHPLFNGSQGEFCDDLRWSNNDPFEHFEHLGFTWNTLIRK